MEALITTKWSVDLQKTLAEISKERENQRNKWGEQGHSLEKWMVIIGEEYGEVCKSLLHNKVNIDKDRYYIHNEEELRNEAIQLVACAAALVQFLDTGSA